MKHTTKLAHAVALARRFLQHPSNLLWAAGGGAGLALVLMSCGTTSRALTTSVSVAGASFAGSEACRQCHAEVFQNFHDRTHNKIITTGEKGLERGCEACHGAGSKHIESGGEKHLIKRGTDNCATCHQDVAARFNMTSHHPLKEGAMTCGSCHKGHADKRSTLSSTTRLCTSCHQNVQGPHVFEHPPVAENCSNCHNPHGSPFRSLLTASQPMLCLQCHSISNNRHGQTGANTSGQKISGAVLRNCTACHGAVHGSAGDQHLRY